MAHVNKVMRSINRPDGQLCVDVFLRPDGSYGFAEYRRDPEDPRGWYPIGSTDAEIFATADAALTMARERVAWLREILA